MNSSYKKLGVIPYKELGESNDDLMLELIHLYVVIDLILTYDGSIIKIDQNSFSWFSEF